MASKEKKAAKRAAEAAAAKKKKYTRLAIIIAAAVLAAALILILRLTKKAPVPCWADIDIQDLGTVSFRLETEKAPVTTANFIELAEKGFYDGLTFHRIIEGFMMQGGDPEGNGTGGSGKNIKGEFAANGVDTGLSHTRGAVSMARSQAYDSASSQFFIVHEDSLFLDGQYAVFGYVTEGMDIVDKICTEAEPTDNNGTIPASAQPVMNSVKIRYE